MALNLVAVQDQITTKLSELPQDVYETSAPDDSKLRFDSSGNLLPYIVVQYSDMYPGGDNGITGARYDAGVAYALITCVSANQRASRLVADAVRDKLTGFRPSDAGELRFAGGSIDYANPDAKPNRYVTEVAFTFSVNHVW